MNAAKKIPFHFIPKPKCIHYDWSLTSTQKDVYVEIYTRAQQKQDGVNMLTWFKYEVVAHRLNISVRHLRRCINALVKKNLIKVIGRPGQTNMIQVLDLSEVYSQSERFPRYDEHDKNIIEMPKKESEKKQVSHIEAGHGCPPPRTPMSGLANRPEPEKENKKQDVIAENAPFEDHSILIGLKNTEREQEAEPSSASLLSMVNHDLHNSRAKILKFPLAVSKLDHDNHESEDHVLGSKKEDKNMHDNNDAHRAISQVFGSSLKNEKKVHEENDRVGWQKKSDRPSHRKLRRDQIQRIADPKDLPPSVTPRKWLEYRSLYVWQAVFNVAMRDGEYSMMDEPLTKNAEYHWNNFRKAISTMDGIKGQGVLAIIEKGSEIIEYVIHNWPELSKVVRSRQNKSDIPGLSLFGSGWLNQIIMKMHQANKVIDYGDMFK